MPITEIISSITSISFRAQKTLALRGVIHALYQQ
jgi:hypothetical protein